LQSSYAEVFERDMGCTEAEWLGWMPAAVGGCAWRCDGRQAVIELPPGELTLTWAPQPPRVIALLRLPVLRVKFEFSGDLDAGQRYAFMKRFDLHMQRGGG